MADAVRLLAELQKRMPDISVCGWLEGQCRTSFQTGKSQKGFLIASESHLLFFSKQAQKETPLLSVAFSEIEAVSAGLSGSLNLLCHLKNGEHVMLSSITQGSLPDFLGHLKWKCFGRQEDLSG
ncbi:hypothetical protein [Planococcus chinensis]|uniref:YokE-like PH domain-containing protein n=1 Tax=Planococcus chinensis TaxID=272917 RepID=A0ABW4QLM8_9BACL